MTPSSSTATTLGLPRHRGGARTGGGAEPRSGRSHETPLAQQNFLAVATCPSGRLGTFGELSVHCAQDVTKAWSAAFFETMKRRKNAEQARLPLRKRWLVPVTWRKGEFALPG